MFEDIIVLLKSPLLFLWFYFSIKQIFISTWVLLQFAEVLVSDQFIPSLLFVPPSLGKGEFVLRLWKSTIKKIQVSYCEFWTSILTWKFLERPCCAGSQNSYSQLQIRRDWSMMKLMITIYLYLRILRLKIWRVGTL